MNSKKFWISLICLCLGVACLYASPKEAKTALPSANQEQQTTVPEEAPIVAFADPLIPQLFAFDKDNQIFAGINKVDNAIDIILYDGDTLIFRKRFVVDVTEKRHDVHFIYHPQSVAIYDGHIVVLASQRDSCFLAVLNVQGEEMQRFYFAGNASAFSYSPESKELYISGENALGYDVAVLDVSKGFEHLNLDPDLNFHYLKPRKAEQMLENDPYGVALTIIALFVVFVSLMLLYFCFKALGNFLTKWNTRKTAKALQAASGADEATARAEASKGEEVSGDEYAAIAAAIFMYQNELHDEENAIITIEKVSRNYSPWNSKIYGMNPYFQIKNGK